MPVLDGFRLAVALRDNERTARVPIIFLSGETSRENEAHGMALGALAYLKKPFDPDRLTSIATGVVARFARSGSEPAPARRFRSREKGRLGRPLFLRTAAGAS